MSKTALNEQPRTLRVSEVGVQNSRISRFPKDRKCKQMQVSIEYRICDRVKKSIRDRRKIRFTEESQKNCSFDLGQSSKLLLVENPTQNLTFPHIAVWLFYHQYQCFFFIFIIGNYKFIFSPLCSSAKRLSILLKIISFTC